MQAYQYRYNKEKTIEFLEKLIEMLRNVPNETMTDVTIIDEYKRDLDFFQHVLYSYPSGWRKINFSTIYIIRSEDEAHIGV